MRFAYADPPYPGCEFYYGGRGVNHPILIHHLENDFDGYALSTNQKNLAYILPMLKKKYRVMAWVKKFASARINVNPGYFWEPVIVGGGRKRKVMDRTRYDWIAASTNMNLMLKTKVVGLKPDMFYFWLLDILNVHPGDEVVDMFPGNDTLKYVVKSHMRQTRIPSETGSRVRQSKNALFETGNADELS